MNAKFTDNNNLKRKEKKRKGGKINQIFYILVTVQATISTQQIQDEQQT